VYTKYFPGILITSGHRRCGLNTNMIHIRNGNFYRMISDRVETSDEETRIVFMKSIQSNVRILIIRGKK
jgi:hypothetical protein